MNRIPTTILSMLLIVLRIQTLTVGLLTYMLKEKNSQSFYKVITADDLSTNR